MWPFESACFRTTALLARRFGFFHRPPSRVASRLWESLERAVEKYRPLSRTDRRRQLSGSETDASTTLTNWGALLRFNWTPVIVLVRFVRYRDPACVDEFMRRLLALTLLTVVTSTVATAQQKIETPPKPQSIVWEPNHPGWDQVLTDVCLVPDCLRCGWIGVDASSDFSSSCR